MGNDDHGFVGYQITQLVAFRLLDCEDGVVGLEIPGLLTGKDGMRDGCVGGPVALGTFVQNVVRVDPVAVRPGSRSPRIHGVRESCELDDHDSGAAFFDNGLNE